MKDIDFLDQWLEGFRILNEKASMESELSVNLTLLGELDLLCCHYYNHGEPEFTQLFSVVESEDKITLINHQFVVWIIPEKSFLNSKTRIIIALNQEYPEFELSFTTSGVYNSSRIIMCVLDKLLNEIEETELVLKEYKEAI